MENAKTMSAEEQKELQVRVTNFNKELQALQQKYKLAMISQTWTPVRPGNQGPYNITNHPIQVIPMEQQAPAPAPESTATKPD